MGFKNSASVKEITNMSYGLKKAKIYRIVSRIKIKRWLINFWVNGPTSSGSNLVHFEPICPKVRIGLLFGEASNLYGKISTRRTGFDAEI